MARHQPDLNARICPACEFAIGLSQGEKNKYQLLSCKNCRTLYTSSIPASVGAQDYDNYYSPKNLSTPDFIHKRLDEIIAGFSAYRQKNRLLDIGFGAGSLLQAADRRGWTAKGTEVSRTAVEYCRNLGFDVICAELADAGHPADYFDVITASELLEHVPNPRALVCEIARVLRPGGLFWATTPHSRGVSALMLGLKWSTISPPEHLQLFSVRGMKNLLADAGFSRIRILTQGVNPFEIIHALRRPRGDGSFNRVGSSCEFNARLIQTPSRRMLKGAMNGLLGLSRLGDSLKIHAEK